ncbi:hypothetical protein KCU98_g2005, partial [Aureobasidium melanogenum]
MPTARCGTVRLVDTRDLMEVLGLTVSSCVEIAVDHLRSSLLTNLGLTANNSLAPLPNYGPHFLLGNFFLSYVLTTTRFQKGSYGVDNNINPRHDLVSPRAEQLVSKGKITQEQLEQLQRIQAAHSNSMEHYTVFAAAVLCAMVAKLDSGMLNKYATLYTAIRAAYFLVYRQNTTRQAAGIRSVLWWAGNIVCIRLFWFAGKALNAHVL